MKFLVISAKVPPNHPLWYHSTEIIRDYMQLALYTAPDILKTSTGSLWPSLKKIFQNFCKHLILRAGDGGEMSKRGENIK